MLLSQRCGWAWLALLATAPLLHAEPSQPQPSSPPSSTIPLNDHDTYHYLAVKLNPSADATVDHARQAEDLGASLGYSVLGRVGELPNYYMLATEKWAVSPLSARDDETLDRERRHHERRIAEATDNGVTWVQAQVPKMRIFPRAAVPCEGKVEVRDVAAPAGRRNSLATRAPPVRLEDIMEELGITDPGFDKQWHLVNTVTVGNDMNVTGVWKQGITGYNSTVCFVDDGLDMDNADLHDNFYAEGSYDFNAHTKSPKPKLAADRHGTRCAGEVAAVKNDICGVGVAYTAKVSGVRILGGPLTEADEAASINYDYQNNQIYSCSWGPTDDGRAMDAPPQLVTDAVYNGIKNGRNGLGSIFVFASGNGEASGDHCNADGYTNSIYTVTVGALDRNNQHPVYSESCTAVMIVMYSSSGQHQDAIYTSDWSQAGNVHCTNNHGGTSAAAPLASGLYALVLQIRPDLNWRDIQYLSVQSAIPVNLDDPGWDTTAAGRPYNPKFGYGKLDGYALVEAAKTFKSVNPQTQIITNVAESHKDVPATPAFLDSKVVVSADNVKAADMKRVEHVTVTVNIDHESRGDVEVQLISPKGIVSQLSVKRAFDADIFGYQNWTFMSVKHWGEDPVGTWTLRVSDALHPAKTGKFNYWWLTLFGETVHGPTVSPSPPIPSAAVPSASSLSTHSTTTTSSKPSPTRPHGSDEEDRLQPPILPTLTTTSTLTSSSSSSPTSSSSSLPVGDGSGGTATSGKVKSSGYALAFGVGVLATAGGGFWYVRRRRSSRSTAGGPQDSTDDYEFELLNDDEVEAAFEDYDDDDEDGGRGASSVQLVGRTSGESGKVPSTTMGVSGGSGTGAGSGKPDRFVLKGMDDDDEGLP